MSIFSQSVEDYLLEYYFDLPVDIQAAVSTMLTPFENGSPPLFSAEESCPTWLLEKFKEQIGLLVQIKEKQQQLNDLESSLKQNRLSRGGAWGFISNFASSLFKPFTEDEFKALAKGQAEIQILTIELQALKKSLNKKTDILSGIPLIFKLAIDRHYPPALHAHLIQHYEDQIRPEWQNDYNTFLEYVENELKPYIEKIIIDNIHYSNIIVQCTTAADIEFEGILEKLNTFYNADLRAQYKHSKTFFTLIKNLRTGITNDTIRKTIEASILPKHIPAPLHILSKINTTQEHALLAFHIFMELEKANKEYQNIIGLEIDFERMDTAQQLKFIKKLTKSISSFDKEDQKLDKLAVLESIQIIHWKPKEVLGFSPESVDLEKNTLDILSALGDSVKSISTALLNKAEQKIQNQINDSTSMQLLNYFFSGSTLSDYLYYLLIDKKNTQTLLSRMTKWGYAALIAGAALTLLSVSTFLIFKYIVANVLIHSLLSLTASITAGTLAVTGTLIAESLTVSFMIKSRERIENGIHRFFYDVKDPERFMLTPLAIAQYGLEKLKPLQHFFKKEINDVELRLESPTTERISENQAHAKLLECWTKIQAGHMEKLEDIRAYLLAIYHIRSGQFEEMIQTQNWTGNQTRLGPFFSNIISNTIAFSRKLRKSDEPSHPLVSSIKCYLGFDKSHSAREPLLNAHSPLDDPAQRAACKDIKALQQAGKLLASLPSLSRP